MEIFSALGACRNVRDQNSAVGTHDFIDLVIIYTSFCLVAKALIIATLVVSARLQVGKHITDRFARTTWIGTAVEIEKSVT